MISKLDLTRTPLYLNHAEPDGCRSASSRRLRDWVGETQIGSVIGCHSETYTAQAGREIYPAELKFRFFFIRIIAVGDANTVRDWSEHKIFSRLHRMRSQLLNTSELGI